MAKNEETAPARKGVATVLATAALTLAVGVTAAGLGGYLQPRPSRVEGAPTSAPVASPAPASEGRIAVPAAGQGAAVVLVPVQRTTVSEPAPLPEQALAQNEPRSRQSDDDDDDHEGRGEHHGRRGDRERSQHHDDD
jgi:hypothetical protein